MQVARWGNSLAIRIPATVVEILDLKEGDEIEVTVADDTLALARKLTRQDALERLRKMRGMMPADWKFNRDELYDR